MGSQARIKSGMLPFCKAWPGLFPVPQMEFRLLTPNTVGPCVRCRREQAQPRLKAAVARYYGKTLDLDACSGIAAR